MEKRITRYMLFTKHNDTANWLMACIMLDALMADNLFLNLSKKYAHSALCKVSCLDTADFDRKILDLGLTKNGYALKLPGVVLFQK